MITIFLIGIIGAIISAVLGTVWYNPGLTLTGKWHMKYLGFDKLSKEEQNKLIEKAKPNMPKIYGAQFVLSFLSSAFIGAVMYYTVLNGASANSVYYYVTAIWLCFVIPMIGQNLLWGKEANGVGVKKFLSDSIYQLLSYVIIVFVGSLFF